MAKPGMGKPRRPLPGSLTLERFAGGKDGSSIAFKKKKQAFKRKLVHKAQLKKEYAKVLKREGMAPPDPPSHQQRRQPEVPAAEADGDATAAAGEPAERRKRTVRPDPFRAAKAKATQRAEEIEQRKQQKAQVESAKQQRESERRKRHALLSAKTKTGQPVMKNKIFDMLSKIQADAA
eukprot:TRINITY_DN5679_c0_g1_i1.p1 TRINITY_DN5679_c0_g1~~TRINITY_DN5679_c0_g1_i1.p1  ORF type:complete len:178 (-),score=62.91 TRINITY_DN5679_c0_g1_i1:196-729(-)